MSPISIFALACLLFLNSARLFGADPDTQAAIRAADSLWAKAIASKDLQKTVAMYDAEAVTAGSAMFPARGPEAFRAQWKELFALPNYDLSWKTDTVIVLGSGTLAYTSGKWHSGTSVGPYLVVWRKQPEGTWKVLIDAAWYSRK